MSNPMWSTQGQTRHEMLWDERVGYRVATLRQGEWVLDLGEEAKDEERWSRFGFPERPPTPPEG